MPCKISTGSGRDIKGAPTVQVPLEYLAIWDLVQATQLNSDDDVFLWKWSANQKYSASSAYMAHFIGQTEVPAAKVLQKTKAPPKCKFFIWLALHNGCWAAQRRFTHNLRDSDSCNLCDQHSETSAAKYGIVCSYPWVCSRWLLALWSLALLIGGLHLVNA